MPEPPDCRRCDGAPQSTLNASDKIPREERAWFDVPSEQRRGVFRGRPANPLSSRRLPAGGSAGRKPGSGRGWAPSTPPQTRGATVGSSRAAPAPPRPSPLPRASRPQAQPLRGPAPPPRRIPLPPPQVTMLAGRPAAVEGLSAPPLHRPPRRCAGCLGVYFCLSTAGGFSRVLGRRSAPGSGSNCGPGVRQPSSRDGGPDRGALEPRPGTRGAERHPLPAEA